MTYVLSILAENPCFRTVLEHLNEVVIEPIREDRAYFPVTGLMNVTRTDLENYALTDLLRIWAPKDSQPVQEERGLYEDEDEWVGQSKRISTASAS